MSEETGFLLCSIHEPNLALPLPCQSTSAENDEPCSMFALIFVCVNVTDVVFKGCDRRSRRILARLSKPVLDYCCCHSICNKLRTKVKQGRGVCRTSHSLLSTDAWPDESRLKVFLSLKFMSASRAKADTRFCCPRPCSYSSSPTQGCRNRDIHMLCEQTLSTSEY